MEPAGRLLRKLKLPGDSVSLDGLALAAWPRAVGKRIASQTRAVSVVRKALIVEVDDAVWQRQLFTLRGQILRKLEQILGPGTLSEVEFRLPALRRPPRRAERPIESEDEADRIQDPVLRKLYKAARKRASA